ncbi:Ribonuclease H-like domain containing protein [Trema orientale]|uniref:Ribonuclease H-like domain containing protein n=1 Tax=Trema orientale TaxID=63057 RepID=A0A2P5ENY9_TREOI|nr:Ribonuclease H-like domain containing protein [Trema orientale]
MYMGGRRGGGGWWLFEFQQAQQLDDSKGSDVYDKNEKWHPPELGVLKLNVDAAVNLGEGTIGVGAVIRDYKGDVMGAMAKRIKGSFDPYIAECFAIREGLAFAKESFLHVRMVETDSLRVVNALGRYDKYAEESLILDDVKCLLLEADDGSYMFILRNGNRASHTLARFALSLSSPLYWLEESPGCISHIVASELLVTNL